MQHYFQTEVAAALQVRVRALFDLGGAKRVDRTPAQLEQLCAEHETLSEFVDALEESCGPGANDKQRRLSVLAHAYGPTVAQQFWSPPDVRPPTHGPARSSRVPGYPARCTEDNRVPGRIQSRVSVSITLSLLSLSLPLSLTPTAAVFHRG